MRVAPSVQIRIHQTSCLGRCPTGPLKRPTLTPYSNTIVPMMASSILQRMSGSIRSAAMALPLCAIAISPPELHAQVRPICPESGGGVTIQSTCVGPTVTITPGSQDTRSGSLNVRIDWYRNGTTLNTNTRKILLRGTNVDASFTHYSTYSTGTINLNSGSNELFATICSTNGVCGSARATYYLDTSAPGVSISPSHGITQTDRFTVTIAWSDDRYLDDKTRAILFDEKDVTSSFTYSGGPTSATSTGTINLASSTWDLHNLRASICDRAGNCMSRSLAVRLDTAKPTISITPSSGTYPTAEHAVSIQWADDVELDSASDTIWLNQVDVTGNFSWSSTGKSATSSGTVQLQRGTNNLTAKICDVSGRCTSQTVHLRYEPVGKVAVSPDGSNVTASPFATRTQSFKVKNTGAERESFRIRATCAGTAGGCSASVNSLSLNPGDSATVVVSYSVGSSGEQGRVELHARSDRLNIADVGYVNVTVSAGSSMVIDVVSANPGTAVARDQCLLIAAGPAAASECGDLRIVHPLPSTATYNKARAPTLYYNSQHAHPHPTVSAYVTLPTSSATTQSVSATLTIAGESITRAWATTSWTPGQTRLITLAFNGTSLATGVYPYTLEVTWLHSGGSAVSHSVSGELIVVNRSSSSFGAGWWLAGLEQLVHLSGGRKLWIGGTGSARVYEPAGTNTWVARSITRPDTLRATAVDSLKYFRALPSGDTVWFDAAGRHVRTVNRIGHATTFVYSNGNLQRIKLPAPPGVSRDYVFHYTGTVLDSIVAPGVHTGGASPGRVTTLAFTGGRVASIQDPGLPPVHFAYSGSTNRITKRTDRRGNVTAYEYDNAGKVKSVRRYMSGSAPAAGDLITTITTLEERSRSSPRTRSSAYAIVDGPRQDVADVTQYFLNGWGAPTKVVDPTGGVTEIFRGDDRFPGLVTAVRYPAQENGTRRMLVATYDARGNVETVTEIDPYGDGRNATTRYAYDDAAWPSFVTRVVSPMQDSVVISYNAHGNPESQREANGSTVYFHYDAVGAYAGMLRRIQGPGGVPADSIVYDSFGNVAEFWARGTVKTEYHKDAIGRDTLIVTPIDSGNGKYERRYIRYDQAGRDTLVLTIGPEMRKRLTRAVVPGDSIIPADTVRVRTSYDAEGNTTLVVTEPNRSAVEQIVVSYTYDRANRRQYEGRAAGSTLKWWYDEAGNVVKFFAGRDTIRMEYDEANRITHRITPPVRYAAGCGPHGDDGYLCHYKFPFYPNEDDGSGLTIPGDTATFTYDAAGNLRTANNRSARITRTYYPNGMLKTDELRIRRYAPQDSSVRPPPIEPEAIGLLALSDDPYPDAEFNEHVFKLEYRYDLNGRRTELHHPRNLVGSGQPTRYEYNPAGQLKSVQDHAQNLFEFYYDSRGRLIETYGPGGTFEERRYDDFDRLVRRIQGRGGSVILSDSLEYDARDKLLRVYVGGGLGYDMINHYSGLGVLAASEWRRGTGGYDIEEWYTDPLGHADSSRTSLQIEGNRKVVSKYWYSPGSSAVDSITVVDSTKGQNQTPDLHYSLANRRTGDIEYAGSRKYDPNGTSIHHRVAETRYYGADGRLYYLQKYDQTGNHLKEGTFNEYRYDALGRRVLMRIRRDSLCSHSPSGCESSIERFVWDGDQLLWEMRADGAHSLHLNELNSLSGSGPKYGKVVYTHAGEIDAPLAVTRSDHGTIVLHSNYRGDYNGGTWAHNGAAVECHQSDPLCVKWPAHKWNPFYRGNIERGDWIGSLVYGQQDVGGLMYRRNRYYDPETGQFTQPDPIGIAGGFNLYGYADGDPVSYSDPFGLSPCLIPPVGVLCGELLLAGLGATATFISAKADDLAAGIEGFGRAVADGISGLGLALKNKHIQGRIQGEIDVINEHFGYFSGGHGDPNDPRNRDKWKKDIRRHLDEMRKYIDRLKGDRNKERWLDQMRQLEDRLRDIQ